MSSNQRYGALNRRFEKRFRFLRKYGFAYQFCEAIGKAIFVRTSRRLTARIGEQDILTCDCVMLANNAVWRDELSRILRRF